MYAQVTSLFHEATDLLEDFKQFLPESAAQAKAAAAKQAQEDEANARNLMANLSQTPIHNAHAGRPDPKMPPVGNFAPPPSTSKEGRKRPRAGITMNNAGQMGASEALNGRGSVGGSNKVSGTEILQFTFKWTIGDEWRSPAICLNLWPACLVC